MLEFPDGGGNRIKLDREGYIKVAFAFLIIIGSIVLYVFEFRQFDLILEMKRLLLYALVVGLVIGIWVSRKLSAGEQEAFERMRIYMITVLVVLIFSPLYISLLNRWLDFREPEYREASFEKADAYISENYGVLKGEDPEIAGYKLTLVLDQEVLQLKAKQNPFPNNKTGDKVLLPIKRGLFGISYVSFENQ